MKWQAGVFLESTEALNDTVFARTTIFITELNAKGAVGFVINKPFGRSLNELEEFKHSTQFPLYDGGPVDKEHLFFLHMRPDIIDGGNLVANNVFWGGNFSKAVTDINNGSLSSNEIKIFVGYCGWDAGELEAEIAEGSWIVAGALNEKIFRSYH